MMMMTKMRAKDQYHNASHSSSAYSYLCYMAMYNVHILSLSGVLTNV